jgi:uncharacterized protein (TIGR02246 family)
MYRRWTTIPLIWLLSAVAGLAEAEQAEEAAIRSRVQEYVAAFNRVDAKAAASVYAVDGTHTYALGFTHRGRAAIEKGLAELLAGPFKGTRLTITTDAIRFLTPSIAIEEESFVVSGLKTSTSAEAPPVKGSCLDLVQKQGGRWFAAAVQCMVPLPTPEAPGKTEQGAVPFSEADRAAIRQAGEAFARYAQATPRNDKEPAAYYEENALMLAPNRAPIRGRAGIEAFLAAFPPFSNYRLETLELEGRADLAYERGVASMTLTPAGAAPAELRIRYLLIWRRQADGSWLVSREMFTPDGPPN